MLFDLGDEGHVAPRSSGEPPGLAHVVGRAHEGERDVVDALAMPNARSSRSLGRQPSAGMERLGRWIPLCEESGPPTTTRQRDVPGDARLDPELQRLRPPAAAVSRPDARRASGKSSETSRASPGDGPGRQGEHRARLQADHASRDLADPDLTPARSWRIAIGRPSRSAIARSAAMTPRARRGCRARSSGARRPSRPRRAAPGSPGDREDGPIVQTILVRGMGR